MREITFIGYKNKNCTYKKYIMIRKIYETITTVSHDSPR